MKKIHLLCNAHLDPVWLWQRNEGAAEAISTFRVAADFCEKYDGFIFNHNEALLYEWVEEYEPALFERIKRLVKEGKWVIMGGWYLQPDCVMTSGESLLSQINLGREYFKEKFGVVPTTAINFDPFGHSQGLVQILKRTGFENYVYMRPGKWKDNFRWRGFDGSEIIAHKTFGGYNTLKGEALNKVKQFESENPDDVSLLLWGIGNHGGGPSKIDLEAINGYMAETDTEMVHSSMDEYFKEIDKENLPVVEESLIPSMVGCYTSMVRIKQANRRLENKLNVTQKIMSYADMTTDFSYDTEELNKAKKALAFCQFHDVLPGSSIKPVEDDCLATLSYGEEIADKLYARAFFKMCEGQKEAKAGEIPVMVFNPHPFPIDGEFEIGFMLENQNWNEGEQTLAVVYDSEGNALPTQNEKPDCTFNLDWIQKVSFKATIEPSSVSRFDCKLTVYKAEELPEKTYGDDYITVENDRMTARISKATGLIDLYKVDGNVLIENSGKLRMYNDNEDPWGMTVSSFNDLYKEFNLMSDEDANEFIGYADEKISNVRIIEDGVVRTKVQAIFECGRTVAVAEYTLPKFGTYIDVKLTVYSNTANKMIKYCFDTALKGTPWGETAFGEQTLYSNGDESVFHKWCGIREGDKHLYIINNGTYGGCFTESEMRLSLLRTPVYSAHPINDRQIAPHDRMHSHIDMGERQFSFRITTEDNIEREALIFNESPRLLSFFPSGDGDKKGKVIDIDNEYIVLSSVKKNDNGYTLTLHNFSDKEQNAVINIYPLHKEIPLHFGKYELKIFEI